MNEEDVPRVLIYHDGTYGRYIEMQILPDHIKPLLKILSESMRIDEKDGIHVLSGTQYESMKENEKHWIDYRKWLEARDAYMKGRGLYELPKGGIND